MTKYRSGLAELPTYDVHEKEYDIKVDANESNLNLPPLVQERVVNRLGYLAFNRYPDSGMSLREEIADNFGLTTDNILLGNGSSELLEKLFFAFGGQGNSIVFPTPSFSMYNIYAKISDTKAVAVCLEENYTLIPGKVLATAEDEQATLIVICTPNNPTGNVVPLYDIEYILKNAQCPVVIDEAYVEFHGISAVSLLEKYDKLIICRTFSKAYGFASARIGYMLAAKDIITMVAKTCMPFHVNALTLAAAEIVYQMRDEFIPVIKQTVAERQRMEEKLQTFKEMVVYPSETNFILIKLDKANQLNEFLEQNSIGVRSFNNAPQLESCIRITIGTPEENDVIFSKISEFINKER